MDLRDLTFYTLHGYIIIGYLLPNSNHLNIGNKESKLDLLYDYLEHQGIQSTPIFVALKLLAWYLLDWKIKLIGISSEPISFQKQDKIGEIQIVGQQRVFTK